MRSATHREGDWSSSAHHGFEGCQKPLASLGMSALVTTNGHCVALGRVRRCRHSRSTRRDRHEERARALAPTTQPKR